MIKSGWNKAKKKPHGKLRRGQLLHSYGPGSLFDLPDHAAIVGGLDNWMFGAEGQRDVNEDRLQRSIQRMTGKAHRLVAPPDARDTNDGQPAVGITAYRFPEWLLVQEEGDDSGPVRSRRLVQRHLLSKGKYEGRPVVAIRFVAACPAGHIADVDWRYVVHGHGGCYQQLWLDESGTTGDLSELVVRCDCGSSRPLNSVADPRQKVLGGCKGQRPWLGVMEPGNCSESLRLLNRTGSNAYFAQRVTVLSIPSDDKQIDLVVETLWSDLAFYESAMELLPARRKHREALEPFSDDELMAAIARRRLGLKPPEPPIKVAELAAILGAPPGYGNDIPGKKEQDFHVRRLPDAKWRKGGADALIAGVYQLHRLREVSALVGFTRFEPISIDINGEYPGDVKRAEISLNADWYPAVENRGEGVFIELRADAVNAWLARPAVKQRVAALEAGFKQWATDRTTQHSFPGGAYVMLHTLSHLLLQSVALRSGYAMGEIRERIYADTEGGRYGLLLYTGSADEGGTLGGLVQQAHAISEHLSEALREGALCSNDPVCAQHSPDDGFEERWLHGAACHGCTLIGESSCEMMNDFLDRALIVPVIGLEDAAFFAEVR